MTITVPPAPSACTAPAAPEPDIDSASSPAERVMCQARDCIELLLDEQVGDGIQVRQRISGGMLHGAEQTVIALRAASSPIPADLAKRITAALECGALWTEKSEAHTRMQKALADFNEWVAAAPAKEPAQPVARTNDEQLLTAIETALPMLNTEARKALTFVRWKDGIDCDYVTAECQRFVAAVLRNLAVASPVSAPDGVDALADMVARITPENRHGPALEDGDGVDALLREAVDALETCRTGGHADIDGDWRETKHFDGVLITATLAKLREHLGDGK